MHLVVLMAHSGQMRLMDRVIWEDLLTGNYPYHLVHQLELMGMEWWCWIWLVSSLFIFNDYITDEDFVVPINYLVANLKDGEITLCARKPQRCSCTDSTTSKKHPYFPRFNLHPYKPHTHSELISPPWPNPNTSEECEVVKSYKQVFLLPFIPVFKYLVYFT